MMDTPRMFTGYDGHQYQIGDRVELHPGTDLWMQGARYGEVKGSSLTPDDRVRVELDKLPGRLFSGPEDRFRKLSPALPGCRCSSCVRAGEGG